MEDSFHRNINYLRVSVTDRCNLRCRYCMPAAGVPLKKHQEILRLEEIVQVVRCAVELGFTGVRLTGGEPLVRRDLRVLISALADLPGLQDLSLTTNGTLLAGFAQELKQAGLKRVNISLDTLNRDRFHYLTRGGELDRVWEGIKAALQAGFQPVKINVVVVAGFNETEIMDFVALAREYPLLVRFIELMPIGESAGQKKCSFMSVAVVKQQIAAKYQLVPETEVTGNGPARYYRIGDTPGTIGFVGALTEHFCDRCNRLRLTAEGYLRPCLQRDLEVDIKTPLRQGADPETLQRLFQEAIAKKPQRHTMYLADQQHQHRMMSEIGG